jgi:hypothetical protein
MEKHYSKQTLINSRQVETIAVHDKGMICSNHTKQYLVGLRVVKQAVFTPMEKIKRWKKIRDIIVLSLKATTYI